jgi:3-dehydroquinate dehydratase-2
MNILIINGPNLNLLGKREPGIYGNISFEDYFSQLKADFDMHLDYFQSNVEGELINALHASEHDGIIINAGAYTHTSVALRDAISAIKTPTIEVHISNVTQRETFRHDSYLSPVCVGCIFGFGMEGYRLALQYFERNQKGN